MILDNISAGVGKTPLIKLNKLSNELHVNLFAKTESRNPNGSVKCRIAYAMIDDAEQTNALNKNMTILEASSGNTGIALAAMGRSKGYDVEIVMPESMSIERRQLISGLGAKLTLTPAVQGMAGAIAHVQKLVADNSNKYCWLDQFSNTANPAIHILTTGPEIDLDSEGVLDVIVAGVGTGGTISGLGYYFKNIRKMDVQMVAVEPENSPVISQHLNNEPLKPAAHKIQGIGAGFIPKTLDLSVIDMVVQVSDDNAINMARRVMRDEGILCGISGGAALAGAINAVESHGWTGNNIAVILPDSGERYLSTALYK